MTSPCCFRLSAWPRLKWVQHLPFLVVGNLPRSSVISKDGRARSCKDTGGLPQESWTQLVLFHELIWVERTFLSPLPCLSFLKRWYLSLPASSLLSFPALKIVRDRRKLRTKLIPDVPAVGLGKPFFPPVHAIVDQDSSQRGQWDVLRWRRTLNTQAEQEQYFDRKQHVNSTVSGVCLVRTGAAGVREGEGTGWGGREADGCETGTEPVEESISASH